MICDPGRAHTLAASFSDSREKSRRFREKTREKPFFMPSKNHPRKGVFCQQLPSKGRKKGRNQKKIKKKSKNREKRLEKGENKGKLGEER